MDEIAQPPTRLGREFHEIQIYKWVSSSATQIDFHQ